MKSAMPAILVILGLCGLHAVAPLAACAQQSSGHYDYVPHSSTHYHVVPHGNHYHTVPHTTTHYDRVWHDTNRWNSGYVSGGYVQPSGSVQMTNGARNPVVVVGAGLAGLL